MINGPIGFFVFSISIENYCNMNFPNFLKFFTKKESIDINEKEELFIEGATVGNRERIEIFNEVPLHLKILNHLKRYFVVFLVVGLVLGIAFWMLGGNSAEPKKAAAATLPDLSNYTERQFMLENELSFRDFMKRFVKEEKIIQTLNEDAKAKGLSTLLAQTDYNTYSRGNSAASPDFLTLNKDRFSYYLITIKSTLPSIVEIQRPQEQDFVAQTWILKEDMLDIITQEQPLTKITMELVEKIEDILSWSIGLRSLRKGDIISLLWEIRFIEGQPLLEEDKKIVALIIRSSSVDTTLHAFRYSLQDEEAFYDWKGRPWERQFLCSPVKYGKISSRFNLSRFNPVFKTIKPHRGTDYAAPRGTEIYALADGKVEKILPLNGNNGNYIKLSHGPIYSSGYLHLSGFAEGLKKGDKVKQGQVIGYVGSTGASTGPHVCLRFWRRNYQDDFVDAFKYLPKPDPIHYTLLPAYVAYRDSIMRIFEKEEER